MIEVSLAELISHAPFLFIAALIVLVCAVMLKSVKAFLLELLLLLIMVGMNIDAMPAIFIVVGAVQVLLGLYILFRIHKALDYNYRLILEKTHQAPRKITGQGHNGTRQSF